MKFCKNWLRLISILIVFCSNNILFATGSIRGTISDSLSGEPLLGANVFLQGTAFGAAADFEGTYIIRSIPAGEYILKVSYIGYSSIERKIDVKDDQTIELDFRMKLDIVEGNEVIVMGQAQGQAAAINQQLSSSTISNIVSSERIMEMPDANAAESVGRLPGISIMREGGEGNKVVIRGLSPTYNAITIGGVRVPATDLNDRSVDLSMISPEILSGIEVTKALTADKDADAIGGTVDFKLATAKRGGFYQNLRFQTGYNNLRNEYGQYKGRLIVSNRFFEDRLGILVSGNIEKTQRGADEFSAEYSLVREKRPGEKLAPISANNVIFEHRIDQRKRLGFNVLLDYEIPGGKIKLNNFVSRLDEDTEYREKNLALGSNWILYDYVNKQRQIGILSNSLEGEHDINWVKIDWGISRTNSRTRDPNSNIYRFKQTSGFDNSAIPEVAKTDDIINNATIDLSKTYLYHGTSESELASETNWTYQANFALPFSFSENIAGNLKLGSKYTSKTRNRDRGYALSRLDGKGAEINKSIKNHHTRINEPGFNFYNYAGNPGMSNYLDDSFDFGNFLDGKYDFGYSIDANEMEHLLKSYLLDSLFYFSPARDLEDYTVDENVFASYIMSEVNIGRYLMFLPGLRYERTEGNYNGKIGNVPTEDMEAIPGLIRDTSAVKIYDNFFPMVHLRVKFADWYDIRLAYTQSMSRPRLDFLLPTVRVIGSDLAVELGQPDLKPQLTENFDAYLSMYGNKIGLFTLGGFYKSIDNLIFQRMGHKILNPADESFPSQWKGFSLTQPENNPYKTEVYGFETEWQSNFTWLDAPFDGLVVNVNYSHIWSNTKFPRSFVQSSRIPEFPYILTTVIDTFRTGPMPNQASDIVNLSVGYDRGGFSGRISLLVQGKTLMIVGERAELDGFSDTYTRLDLLLKYQFNESIGLFWNLNNLLNEADQTYQNGTNYPTNEEFYGWTTDIGLVYKL